MNSISDLEVRLPGHLANPVDNEGKSKSKGQKSKVKSKRIAKFYS